MGSSFVGVVVTSPKPLPCGWLCEVERGTSYRVVDTVYSSNFLRVTVFMKRPCFFNFVIVFVT